MELEEFFRDEYQEELEKIGEEYPDKKSIQMDFSDLESYDYNTADELIEKPDKMLRRAEEELEAIGIHDQENNEIVPNIRFFNLPEERTFLIRDINSDHLNQLIATEGVITKITDVRPKVNEGVFECRRCGRTQTIEQDQHSFGKLKEPAKCACKRKDFKLKENESKFIDMQKMEIQEPLEALVKGEQAKTIDVWLEDDLTNKLYPGDKVIVTGVVKLRSPSKKSSAVYDIYLDSIHIQQVEKEFEEIEITQEEEKEIEELAKDPEIYQKIINSIAPTIYGHREIKEAIALQLFGGTKNKVFPDQSNIRPDVHVLLIGDPGTAKSMILEYLNQLAPKGIFVSGKSATGAGLTASAEKDEFGEGGWTLKAGALVLASGGHAAIDEFDKMTTDDRSSMHEAMEQQTISVAKAGIVTTFKAKTAVLAAANPKYGRFDPHEPPAKQFDIPPTLLSRFDLIFPIKDVMDEERDREMADHILNSHQAAGIKTDSPEVLSEDELDKAIQEIEPVLDIDLLRKYISYTRKHCHPVLTKDAIRKIKEYYTDLRMTGEQSGAVPITPRQLEALVRLAEASAKGRLSEEVQLEDARRAIKLHKFVMREIGVDQETGRMDIDIIATGKPKSKIDKVKTLYAAIKDLSQEYDKVTHDQIVDEAEELGIEPEKVNDLLSILKKKGDIYSPKHGEYKIAGQ